MLRSLSALRSTRWCVQDYRNEPDEALVERAKGGDARAVEVLMDRYKNLVLRCARKSAFHLLAETDDLVQEGMIGLYAAIGSFDPNAGCKFKTFVYTCVTRKIYSYLRFVNRREPSGERTEIDPESLAEGVNPEEVLLLDESEGEFRRRLSRELSDFEFRVVTMYLEGLSYASISEETGRGIKSIDNALSRAKKKLQKAFSADV